MAYKTIIKKERVQATLRTRGEEIEGTIFLLPDTRLLDMVNDDREAFIAVSEAKVYSVLTRELLFSSEFLAVNKKHIVIITEETNIADF